MPEEPCPHCFKLVRAPDFGDGESKVEFHCSYCGWMWAEDGHQPEKESK